MASPIKTNGQIVGAICQEDQVLAEAAVARQGLEKPLRAEQQRADMAPSLEACTPASSPRRALHLTIEPIRFCRCTLSVENARNSSDHCKGVWS